MCGICGVISLYNKSVNVDVVRNMVNILEHRGPDDSGYLFFHTGVRHNPNISFYLSLTEEKFKDINKIVSTIENVEIQRELHEHDYDLFLGFRRLAILDLSYAGHQPFCDLSKNIWVIFNGEIYNYIELRNELKNYGHKFKSNSDTEVIVYSYIQWGIDCIKRFNGMFAFALYDNFKKKLYIVRDRYGIKPLYWTFTRNGDFIFASEVKSILQYPTYSFSIDYEALVEYFTFQNFLSNRILFKDIYLLEQGTYIEIDLLNRAIKKNNYWDFDFFRYKDFSFSLDESIDKLESCLGGSVNRQLISDVEVGAYLSGGIDTGLIVCFASKYLKNLKTFTIGFDLSSASGLELSFDERSKAEYMSYLFTTEHYEMVLKAGDMERCLRKLVYHLEEPRVGQSYPNFYASKLASKFVKVVLSGTGGDELFGGYPWRYLSCLNSKSINDFIDKYYLYWNRLVDSQTLSKIFAPIDEILKNISTKEIFISIFGDKLEMVKDSVPDNLLCLAFYFEAKTFLNGLLIVEDKLSMAHSLETRVPFLDNYLVDFALSIPPNLKLSNLELNEAYDNEVYNKQKFNSGKYLLRLLADKLVDKAVAYGMKQGFSAPDNSWFKGDSINFVKNKLLNKNSEIYNFMDRKVIYELLEDHFEGRKNRRLLIWSLLYLEYWLDIYGKNYNSLSSIQ